MTKIISETQDVYKIDGWIDSDSLTIEHEDGIVDLGEILKRINSKFVRFLIVASDALDVPFVDDKENVV